MEVQNRILVGVGLDCGDGHIRITKGKDFRLFGGSDETHAFMQEKAVKLAEAVERKGQTIGGMREEELIELTEKLQIPYCRIRQQIR